MPRQRVAAIACAVLLLTGLDALAQAPGHVEVTDEIATLNEAGVSASLAGDYETAVAKFRASLELQELNLTYVNLGRALAALGDCDGARAAYDQTAAAPRVESPTPEEVLAVVYKYRVELDKTCVLERVEMVETPVGPAEPQFEAPPTALPPADADASGASYAPWSWVAFGIGGALVLSGVVVDVALLSADFDDLDRARDQAEFDALKAAIATKQGVSLALFATGGLLAATGAVLVILDLSAGPESSQQAFASPWVSRDSAGLGVTLRW